MFPALLIGTLARADLTKVPVLGGRRHAARRRADHVRPLPRAPPVARRAGSARTARPSRRCSRASTRWQAFVALPVAGNLFGDLGLALASVALVAMTPLLNVLCVSVLVRYASPGAPDWRDVLQRRGAKSADLVLRDRDRAQSDVGFYSATALRFRRCARALLARARPADRRRRLAPRRTRTAERSRVRHLRAQARRDAGGRDRNRARRRR